MQPLLDLWYGFGVALQPSNLVWSFFGVLVGNLIGVLPGMGPLSAISMLLPLTYAMQPVPAILMLAGIFYGSLYGGAIGAILLNLPTHPPHAVTCLDGYALTKQGRGGAALALAIIASFVASCFGVAVMVFASPLLVKIAFTLDPADIFSIMLLGLVAGSTMGRGEPLKGVAMTAVGIVVGLVGTDVNSGVDRFTLGFTELSSKVELVAVALGLFGVAEFLRNVNRLRFIGNETKLRVSDMRPSKAELKSALPAMIRGTLIGTLFGALPGTGSTISTFIAYAFERRVSKHPERFGTGEIAGVAGPEAAAHAKTQIDFIPTMTLGIPGEAMMALLLSALLIQGVEPGPQLISQHPDIFWGLIASFWVGNVLLVILNMPLIGVWLKLLRIPYRLMFPCALFFISIGVFSTNNSLFEIGEVIVFGIAGAVLLALDFPLAPILLGYVLGPMVEENFRRALLMSRGDLSIFVQRPVSVGFLSLCALVLVAQIFLARIAATKRRREPGKVRA